MPRPLRVHVPGGFYHVTLRGNHRRPIFFTDADRDLFETIVIKAIRDLHARVHAYCWMTNHIHMLVQISENPLGKLMLRIASTYARTVQSRLETTGHLFERRFHAVLVQADRYLLELLRYIHLNPVRAGLAADPALYPWSSHRTYLGTQQQDWVTTDFALGMLDTQRGRAIGKYRELIGSTEPCKWGTGRLTPHRDDARILGSDDFVAAALNSEYRPRPHKTLDDLILECCQRFQVAPDLLVSPSRARHLAPARAWLAHEAVAGRVASICELARRLDRNESAIRQVMSRHPPAHQR